MELLQSCAKPSKYSSTCHISVQFPEQWEVTNHKHLAQMALFLEIQNNDVNFYLSFIFSFDKYNQWRITTHQHLVCVWSPPQPLTRVQDCQTYTAEAKQEASLLSGAGKCFSARVWNTRLQTWGRKTCKKMSSICRGLDKMANILHAIFSKALSWQKFNTFWLSLRVYLITNHQWLRQLFGAEPVASRYLIWWMASAPGNILYNEFENYRHISQGPIS